MTEGQRCSNEAVQSLVAELRSKFGDRIVTNKSVLLSHGKGEAFHASMPPDAVFYPETTEEVASAVRACSAQKVPVIAFGAGTSLEGHVAAPLGGLCIDFLHMTQLISVSADDLDCRVEAGMTREALNLALRDTGLFFPIDPGANATIGGMAATRASGTNAVRYGTMRQNVMSLTVVLADGTITQTARRARKSSAGLDMTALFVGSEGTLGVITEIGLRLQPIPDKTVAIVATFPHLADATQAVIALMQMALDPARIELLDEQQIDACNRYSNASRPIAPTLFIELHGSEAGTSDQLQLLRATAEDYGALSLEFAKSPEERSRLWRTRYDAYHAAKALRPGCEVWSSDVCVPISRLADCIIETRADIDAAGLIAPIVGHVGDGNFHVLFVLDPSSPEEYATVSRINGKLIERALAMEGTCTGEHGVGIGKRQMLVDEHGQELVDAMKKVKCALDPLSIMNPGKIFLS